MQRWILHLTQTQNHIYIIIKIDTFIQVWKYTVHNACKQAHTHTHTYIHIIYITDILQSHLSSNDAKATFGEIGALWCWTSCIGALHLYVQNTYRLPTKHWRSEEWCHRWQGPFDVSWQGRWIKLHFWLEELPCLYLSFGRLEFLSVFKQAIRPICLQPWDVWWVDALGVGRWLIPEFLPPLKHHRVSCRWWWWLEPVLRWYCGGHMPVVWAGWWHWSTCRSKLVRST